MEGDVRFEHIRDDDLFAEMERRGLLGKFHVGAPVEPDAMVALKTRLVDQMLASQVAQQVVDVTGKHVSITFMAARRDRMPFPHLREEQGNG